MDLRVQLLLLLARRIRAADYNNTQSRGWLPGISKVSKNWKRIYIIYIITGDRYCNCRAFTTTQKPSLTQAGVQRRTQPLAEAEISSPVDGSTCGGYGPGTDWDYSYDCGFGVGLRIRITDG